MASLQNRRKFFWIYYMIQGKYLDCTKNKNSHTFLMRTQTYPAAVEISMEFLTQLCDSRLQSVRETLAHQCAPALLIAAKL